MSDHRYPRVSLVYPIRMGEPLEYTTDRTLRQPDSKVVPASAIVIERIVLPEVRLGRDARTLCAGQVVDVDPGATSPETLRAHALGYLVLAEHLEANPPLDEAQIDPLAEAISDAYGFGDEHAAPYHIARHLIRNGWTKEPRP